MIHEIDMQAENVEDLIEQGMKNYFCAALRMQNGEITEMCFADSEYELKPRMELMDDKPGQVQFWSKGN